ncbi:hypothetical protein JWG45_00935 [Leptospira sp. 201903070]|uniref:Lipoprotein n=1 Tax=Leptospira ainlahdjerensis TaxID=2810033 RepID=A0ABS2U5R4_9LEPT|nr:hypothetical protein [Leptospira ainlahdjerensis]MBM9575706.1 hypothetical protein [Leptospira ainlahdjerensis]
MMENAKLRFPTIGIFVLLISLGMSCQPYMYRNYNDCARNDSGNCDGYRRYSSYGFQNRPGYPGYYRNDSNYGTNGIGNGGSGFRHNPMHIPSGRFHNLGRPSRWKL